MNKEDVTHIHQGGCVLCGSHSVCAKCDCTCGQCLRRDPKAVAERKYGHKMEDDPPFASSINRWTCATCGRAVLQAGKYAKPYGSAIVERCEWRQ